MKIGLIYTKLFSRVMIFAAAAAGLFATANSSKASLIAYEPFDYATDVRLHTGLTPVGSAFGWGGNWGNLAGAITNNAPVQSGSLFYSDGFGNILNTSGNSVFVTGNGPANGLGGTLGSASPNLALTLGRGTNGVASVTWISFLSQVVGPAYPYTDPAGGTVNYGRAQGINLMMGGNERMLLGRSSQNGEPADPTWPNDTWALNIRGSATFSTNASISTVPLTSLTLVLVGIFHDGNPANFNDTAYMWLNPSDLANPTNSAPDATISADTFTGADRDLNFDRIRLFAGSSNNVVGWGNILFDEIRIGDDTPQDVLPFTAVPEPAAACLLGLAGLGLIFRLRKNRQ